MCIRDSYAYSTYKTFGPHQGVLWGSPDTLRKTEGQSHWFNEEKAQVRLNPTGPQHAQVAALAGITEYFDALHRHHFGHDEGNRHTRAKSVFELVARHESKVPREMDVLVKLPGVGRKTANVVLGTAYNLATGVVVDTHVGRISRRLGMTIEKDPVKCERDLMSQLSRKEWILFSHRMIHHGRQVCMARKPACDRCRMLRFCPQVGVLNG